MPKQRYEELEHTADFRLKVYGADERDLFENAAFALSDMLVDLSDVREAVIEVTEGEGADYEETLVDFLSEVLYRFEGEKRIFRDFEILELSPEYVRSAARGETFDPGRHKMKNEIKAVTFHDIEIKRGKGGLSVIITFDV